MYIFWFLTHVTAPGGFVVQDPDPEKPSRTNVSVFSTEENVEKQKSFYEVGIVMSIECLPYGVTIAYISWLNVALLHCWLVLNPAVMCQDNEE